MNTSLTRAEFRKRCLERDKNRCVICGRTDRPLDVHHIIERRLFEDGGYFVDNGATLCDDRTDGCHTKAEQTLISPKTLRQACGITSPILPNDLYPDVRYTKWGDIEDDDGNRSPGPLFWDESVQRILAEANMLERYNHHVRYGRTWHLPISKHVTSDDRQLKNISHFAGREVVITIKLDGQNLSLYHDGLHGRSLHGASHPSQSIARNIQPSLMLDPDMRLIVENLQARHTLRYTGLAHHLYIISLWQRGTCLSWDETQLYSQVLDLPTVPLLWRDTLADDEHQALNQLQEAFKEAKEQRHEGIVIRLSSEFSQADFPKSVAKAVSARFGQLRDQTHHDWKRQHLVPNLLGHPLKPIWPGESGYDS